MKASKLSKLALGLGFAAALVSPLAAHAESNRGTVGPSYSAAARLNLLVVIPGFIDFRVGTAGAGNIDTITLTVNVANVGDSNPVPGAGGTAAGGTGAAFNEMGVALTANVGSVTITETNDGGGTGLTTGAGDSISFAKISTTATTGTGGGGITPPTLSNAGGGTSALAATSGRRNVRTDTWTYSYINDSLEAEGTYGGLGRGRVTYTATAP